MNLAILVSGGGTNLQRILDAIESKELTNTFIKLVIADRNCYAIERALEKDLPVYLLNRGEQLSEEIDELLKDESIDLIVLAGFLSILSKNFCQKWNKKIINIHPSLLPKFGGKGMYGAKVHEAVLQSKEKKSGATVHYVTPEIDEGEIIAQSDFIVEEKDTVSILQEKVQKVEQIILIEGIRKIKLTLEKS